MARVLIRDLDDRTVARLKARAAQNGRSLQAELHGTMTPSRVILVAMTLLITASAAAQTGLPSSVDWRAHGAVTPVKNTGQCGSDWAFASTGAVEAAHAIKSGKLVSLSEQELIDCSGVDGNQGCNGGHVDNAFKWIARHGITSEAAYPYTARGGTCKYGTATPVVHLTSYREVATDMQSLMTAVAAHPVAVEIEAGSDFNSYGGGIYGCHSATHPNYWVLIVGYGTDSMGRQYWLVKGELGTGWGEHGYMRMTRSNDCKNIDKAFVPVP